MGEDVVSRAIAQLEARRESILIDIKWKNIELDAAKGQIDTWLAVAAKRAKALRELQEKKFEFDGAIQALRKVQE